MTRTILAPMEGVIDHEMRETLTQIGGFTRCVTEFIRVTEQQIPEHVFLRFCPELKTGGTTRSGVPVFLQLLGGNATSMARNAVRAQQLQPWGIDLNFGCPSKTVNKHNGGSVLLKEPKRVGQIVAAVRDAVDPNIPVTAKIRLGFNNHDSLDDIIANIVDAGADELCVHARTRNDRYKPPAYWHLLKKASAHCPIPLIINGEIWSIADAHKARAQSGCADIMLGRGALACPDLARNINANQDSAANSWTDTLHIVYQYLCNTQHKHPLFVSNRAKQWLVFLQMHYPPAAPLFNQIKKLKAAQDVLTVIATNLD